MKLFGLTESLELQSMFTLFTPAHIPVPHDKLFKKLEGFDKNVTVGLELPSEEERLAYGEISFEQPKVHMDLLKHFRSRGNKIYFLEDEEHFRQIASISQRLPELEEQRRVTTNEEQYLSLTEQVDRLAIESFYQSTIGKNDMILRNIGRYKPDLVFLGDGHASHFFRRKSEIYQKYGVEIEDYWRDVVKPPTEHDVTFAALEADEEHSMEYWLKNFIEADIVKVDQIESAPEYENMEIERLYNAVKKGRITDGKPDYIGTWNIDLPHRGSFEVFVESKIGDRVKGRIEDCLGTASFSGFVFSDRISFLKTYINASNSVVGGDIHYDGKLVNGEYVGQYEGAGSVGAFKMKQFNVSPYV